MPDGWDPEWDRLVLEEAAKPPLPSLSEDEWVALWNKVLAEDPA